MTIDRNLTLKFETMEVFLTENTCGVIGMCVPHVGKVNKSRPLLLLFNERSTMTASESIVTLLFLDAKHL